MTFIVTWLFDKLGYMPKIDMQVGKLDVEFKAAWPFPVETKPEEAPVKKPRVKKTRALPSRATVVKTAVRAARSKKAK
jgi:hypothetical protein